jgi:hypothetical protein
VPIVHNGSRRTDGAAGLCSIFAARSKLQIVVIE